MHFMEGFIQMNRTFLLSLFLFSSFTQCFDVTPYSEKLVRAKQIIETLSSIVNQACKDELEDTQTRWKETFKKCKFINPNYHAWYPYLKTPLINLLELNRDINSNTQVA